MLEDMVLQSVVKHQGSLTGALPGDVIVVEKRMICDLQLKEFKKYPSNTFEGSGIIQQLILDIWA